MPAILSIPVELTAVEMPEPRLEKGECVAHVLVIDRFGNAGLNVGHDGLAGTGITLGATVEIRPAASASWPSTPRRSPT